MIGIIIATHGKMSDGLMDASNLIFGGVENLEITNLFQSDDVTLLKDKLLNAYNKVDQNDGVIIFTDLMGASPFNQSTLAINSLPVEKQQNTYVITGVNLPMLLVAISERFLDSSVHEIADSIVNAGREGITKWSINEMNDDEDDSF